MGGFTRTFRSGNSSLVALRYELISSNAKVRAASRVNGCDRALSTTAESTRRTLIVVPSGLRNESSSFFTSKATTWNLPIFCPNLHQRRPVGSPLCPSRESANDISSALPT